MNGVPYPGVPYPDGRSSPPGPYPPGPYPPGPYPPPTGPHQVLGGQGPTYPAPAPPRRTHKWGLGAFVLVEVVFLAVSALIAIAFFGPDQPSVAALGVALAVPTLLAAGTALLATRLRGNGPRIDIGLVWSWRDVGIGLAFGFGGLALTLVAATVYVSIVGPDVSSAVGDIFSGQRAGPLAAVMILLIVVVIAPLCEEIIYRGLLWGALEKHGAGRWVAFAVTTVVFALAHFELTRTPLLLVISIPIGLARVFTGRLLASVVAHQVNNLLPGVALALALTGVVPM